MCPSLVAEVATTIIQVIPSSGPSGHPNPCAWDPIGAPWQKNYIWAVHQSQSDGTAVLEVGRNNKREFHVKWGKWESWDMWIIETAPLCVAVINQDRKQRGCLHMGV